MGSRGCRAVRDDAELEAAATEAMTFSRSGRVIVEEYVEGPEFSVDAVVVDGEIHIRGLADRHIAFLPYFVELGHTMPTTQAPEIVAELLRVFRLGIKAIGIDHGAAKGDIKYCPSRGGAVVGEIAARLSGGYMSGWTYPYASGIEVTREALLAAIGLPGEDQGSDRGWVSAERAFISIPGKVSLPMGTMEAERLPYVKNLFLRAEAGNRVVFPMNNVEKCGNVISQAPDRQKAVEAAEAAVRTILLRLSPNEDATEDFLFGKNLVQNPDRSTWPPEAFSPDPQIRAELADMPEYFSREHRGRRIAVIPFAKAGELRGLDWAGRNFDDSARLALRLGGVELGNDGDVVLGGRFWRALLRGGAQAALYVLDSAGAPGNPD
jgi:biotin carboxylase